MQSARNPRILFRNWASRGYKDTSRIQKWLCIKPPEKIHVKCAKALKNIICEPGFYAKREIIVKGTGTCMRLLFYQSIRITYTLDMHNQSQNRKLRYTRQIFFQNKKLRNTNPLSYRKDTFVLEPVS